MVPLERTTILNDAPVDPDGEFVLYWMVANRRLRHNFALQRAVEWANELDKPLLVFEPLRCGYTYANDRIHAFILQGMADNRADAERLGINYHNYVEPEPNAGKGFLKAICERACVCITDDFPAFMLPRMVAAAGRKMPIRLEKVDANGIFPMCSTDRLFHRAYDFRRFLQKNLAPHFEAFPDPTPTEHLANRETVALTFERWSVDPNFDDDIAAFVAKLPIDHTVGVAPLIGGRSAALNRTRSFFETQFDRYCDDRNHPDRNATCGLSPYLHFGHISAHELFSTVVTKEQWSPDRCAGNSKGAREGWWGMSTNAEAYLDQLITWRELGFNRCANDPDGYLEYNTLPDWARRTIEDHIPDTRPWNYTLAEFERAETHDEIWNAAQRELLQTGIVQNYLRMIWGKKIFEWTSNPHDALQIMITLNDKYALDGRDPNSYSGIFWCLGRFDRAWGPERDIFGKIRFMSTERTPKKIKMKNYLTVYGDAAQTKLV